MDHDEEEFYDPDIDDRTSQSEGRCSPCSYWFLYIWSCRFGIEVTFDLSNVHRHRYLGDVDDVNDGLRLLEEGQEYTIPSISRSGIYHSPVSI